MIGAQLDSWTYGTVRTDNAAGAAVTMEAMRLLQSLKLQPRRTIRAVLWTGHEQGAIGSAAYVKQHLRSGVRESARTTPEFEKFSAYFAAGLYGKIRGVSEEGNAAVEPIFHDWIEPFKHNGMTTVTICRLGGLNDHETCFGSLNYRHSGLFTIRLSLILVPITSSRRHSMSGCNQSDDLKFNSAVLASFA